MFILFSVVTFEVSYSADFQVDGLVHGFLAFVLMSSYFIVSVL